MLGSLRSHFVLLLLAASAACGLQLDVGPGSSPDASLPPEPSSSSGSSSGSGSSSSGDAPTSSSSGETNTSSSGGSGATVPDAGPDAAVADPCTGAFVLGAAEIASGNACAPPNASCAGAASVDTDRIRLTSRAASSTPQAGVYWRHLGLGRNARFRLIANVTTQQPNEAGDGGIQGHGFAFAFVQDGDATPGFPHVREEHPARLGINRLPGFHGAAAFVQTYDGGQQGVLSFHQTDIPSDVEDRVDAWNVGSDNDETFGRTDRTYLRFVIDGIPGAPVSVAMYRLASANDPTPRLIETETLALAAEDRLDYFGVAAARGTDSHSQSGHWLTSLVFTCPAP